MLAACRYKDGPLISLRSTKARATAVWHIEKVTDNGEDKTTDFNNLFPNYTLDIKENGDYNLSITGFFAKTETGTWEFQDNGKKINLKKDGTGTNVWNITRLKHNSMWVNQTDNNGHVIVYRLKD